MNTTRLFIVFVYGLYGGQWYCAVHAANEDDAVAKSMDRYQINDDNWQDLPQHNTESTQDRIETELVFDEHGVSNPWFVGW